MAVPGEGVRDGYPIITNADKKFYCKNVYIIIDHQKKKYELLLKWYSPNDEHYGHLDFVPAHHLWLPNERDDSRSKKTQVLYGKPKSGRKQKNLGFRASINS